jgi:ABC-type amino acid transport substrate-binding protein
MGLSFPYASNDTCKKSRRFDSKFQLDGFDIALTHEIGQRLGVQVEYHDYAFDGLGNAPQLKEIDAAIAAISITPERQAVVDFSDVYLAGQDATLTTDQMGVTINLNASGQAVVEFIRCDR